MKRILHILVAIITLGSMFSCEPVEDRNSLPAITKTAADLEFSVTVNANTVTLKNLDSKSIPYWSYTDATGKELGHFNDNVKDFIIPFKGTYYVTYTAYTPGGPVQSEPVKVIIAKTDLSSITTDPKWGMLTNGTAGKTWELNMVNPIGWAGLDYPASSGDNWNWFPDYATNSWVMENKNWGSMTLNLNEGYNISVTQTQLNTATQTTKNGTFAFDISKASLVLSGGSEILFGGDYYPDVSNWATVRVIKITETELELGVIRDQSRKGEGKCQIVFRYKPKS